MTPDGLREYLSKYGLCVPKEGITDKFLLTLHEKIQNNVVVYTFPQLFWSIIEVI